MLNCGRGFNDMFEQECLIHADKLNAQTRYNEWLGKMKVRQCFIIPHQKMGGGAELYRLISLFCPRQFISVMSA